MTVIDSMNHILESINKHYGKVYTQQFVIDLPKAISKLSQHMLLKDIEQSIILDIQFGVARGLTDFWELDNKIGRGAYTATKKHHKKFLMFS